MEIRLLTAGDEQYLLLIALPAGCAEPAPFFDTFCLEPVSLNWKCKQVKTNSLTLIL